MMVIGIGLDLIDLAFFKLHYGEAEPDVLARCFTDRELGDATGADRLEKLASRFAVKEAVYKALGGLESMDFWDVETVIGACGEPGVKLSGTARDRAAELGIDKILISISHSASSAGAMAVAVGKAE